MTALAFNMATICNSLLLKPPMAVVFEDVTGRAAKMSFGTFEAWAA